MKALIDLSKMRVEADENHVDDNGEAREDVLIYEDRLVCHPNMKVRLEEALSLFFQDAQTMISVKKDHDDGTVNSSL